MKARLVDLDKDHEMLCEWWASHGWKDGVVRHALPRLGVIVTDDKDLPLSAGFLYSCDGCSFGLIEWVVSNPNAKPIQVYKSIYVLLGELKELAFKVGSTTLGASLKNKGLIKLYKRHGFVTTDLESTNMLFSIGG